MARSTRPDEFKDFTNERIRIIDTELEGIFADIRSIAASANGDSNNYVNAEALKGLLAKEEQLRSEKQILLKAKALYKEAVSQRAAESGLTEPLLPKSAVPHREETAPAPQYWQPPPTQWQAQAPTQWQTPSIQWQPQPTQWQEPAVQSYQHAPGQHNIQSSGDAAVCNMPGCRAAPSGICMGTYDAKSYFCGCYCGSLTDRVCMARHSGKSSGQAFCLYHLVDTPTTYHQSGVLTIRLCTECKKYEREREECCGSVDCTD
eukprot:Opistho-2@41397